MREPQSEAHLVEGDRPMKIVAVFGWGSGPRYKPGANQTEKVRNKWTTYRRKAASARGV